VLIGWAASLGSGPAVAGTVDEARALRAKHKLAAAEEVLAEALARDSVHLDALLEAGYLAEQARDDPSALKYFSRAAKAHPESLVAQNMAVHAYLWIEDHEHALQFAEAAHEKFATRDPDKTLWSDLLVGLGGAQGMKAERGALAAALKYGLGVRSTFEKAVATDPEHGRAVYALARYYLQAPAIVGGDVAKGFKLLERALRLNPEDSRFQEAYIRALAKHGRKDDARRAYDRYQRRFGDIPGAMREIEDELAAIAR
jgi:predicted Zn-dependent protease